jgi:peptidoglycan hydrolase-like protein with peptidoglycan-binding domain
MLAALAGCAATPVGPTVQVMPGRGKSFDAFQSDQAGCRSFAANQVSGQADAANQRAVGAALLTTVLSAGLGAAVGGAAGDAGAGAAVGAAVGAGGGSLYGASTGVGEQAGIQQQYDNAFAQCMFARGDQVPGFAPGMAGGPAPDPLVRSTQSELIRLGYLHGSADGLIGERTRNAIAAFEQGSGMPTDGAASPQLLARLQSTPAGGSSATASADWVAPAGSRPPAATAAGWVAPTNGAPVATPAAATSSGWVAPGNGTPAAATSGAWVPPTKTE